MVKILVVIPWLVNLGFLRFYFPVIPNNFSLILTLTVLSLIIVCSIIEGLNFKFSKSNFTSVTGCLIFLPVCFVDNPVHAILMGVTMHYSQYIILTAKVNAGRNKVLKTNFQIKDIFLMKFILLIMIYAVLMSSFSLLSEHKNSYLQLLFIIPVIGQMLHFYLDSFIWKFSDKHNREITLNFLVK